MKENKQSNVSHGHETDNSQLKIFFCFLIFLPCRRAYLPDVQVGGAGPAGVAVLLGQQLPQTEVKGRLEVADRHAVVGPLPAALHVTHHYRVTRVTVKENLGIGRT